MQIQKFALVLFLAVCVGDSAMTKTSKTDFKFVSIQVKSL